MKKGISLIVLVITIIVMIVIAGAIILSLSSSNVTARANEAALSSDRANYQATYATVFAEKMSKDDATPTVTIEDLKVTNNAYGAWAIDATKGEVVFKIYADKTAAFYKAYGEKISYTWLSVGTENAPAA